MEKLTIRDGIKKIEEAESIAFLTGAGISTPSGVPDYRSLKGIYHGLDQPEYLLSRTCLFSEPEKFYQFVKTLYHPEARPNVIHRVMAQLEKSKRVTTLSQNIDGLHQKAGSHNRVDFHGSLYRCYCQDCQQQVTVEAYLQSDRHVECGGQLRPDIILYEEGFEQKILNHATEAVSQAELVVIVGTSFQVHPFCDLVYYAKPTADILVINQAPVQIQQKYCFIQADAMDIFTQISTKE